MLELPEAVKRAHDVQCVRKLLISSAPAREATKRAIMAQFRNSRLYEMYGSTEAGWVTVLRPDEQFHKLGSIGRELAGTGPVRLLDDAGIDVADGEVGELHSRTPGRSSRRCAPTASSSSTCVTNKAAPTPPTRGRARPARRVYAA